MFRRTPTEHILQKLIQPDWQMLPTWEQLQTDYKQALADQKAAEAAERKRLAEAAAAYRAKQAEERRKQAEQQRIAQAEKRAKMRTLIQQESSSNTGQQAEAPKRTGGQSSWLMDNILIIGSVVVLVVMGAVFVYKQ